MTDGLTDFQRGEEKGRVNALLDEHTIRLGKINGSIERHAKSVEALAKEIRQTRQEISDKLTTMDTASAARDLAVQVAKETLEKETERLRIEAERVRAERAQALEVPVRAWNLRSAKATTTYGLVAFLLGLYTLYGIFH
jgi:chromosome segregation ATPase